MWTISLAFAAVDVRNLDTTLTSLEAKGLFIGEVRVVDGSQVLLAKKYGIDDDNPVFLVGSITKSFTAAAIYDLADQELLSVDEPVTSYIPELNSVFEVPPTVHQLLTHQGGHSEVNVVPWAAPHTADDVLFLAQRQLTMTDVPGSRYRYSNTGYKLLTEVIRRVSGKSYEDYLTERFFVPLGMKNSGIFRDPGFTTRLVPGHLATPIGPIESKAAFPRMLVHDVRGGDLVGDGALVSSTGDLLIWAAAIRDGRVLSDAARRRMLTPAREQYASAWVIQPPYIWHNGALSPVGYSSYLRWSDQDQVVVAVTSAVDVSGPSLPLKTIVEQALAGKAIEVRLESSIHGTFALISSLCLHWVTAGLGALGLGLSVRRSAQNPRPVYLFTAMTFMGLVVGALGVTSPSLALIGAVAVFGTIVTNGRKLFQWKPSYFLAGTLGIIPLLLGFSLAGFLVLLDMVIANPMYFERLNAEQQSRGTSK